MAPDETPVVRPPGDERLSRLIIILSSVLAIAVLLALWALDVRWWLALLLSAIAWIVLLPVTAIMVALVTRRMRRAPLKLTLAMRPSERPPRVDI